MNVVDYIKTKAKLMGGPMMDSEHKPKPVLPHFQLPISVLPEAENWEVGTTYEIALKVKMTGLRTSEDKKDEYGNQADFDIVGKAILKENK